MSKSYEIQGIIHSIGITTEYGSSGFTKREFSILLNDSDENPDYPNHVLFELIKDKCLLMDTRKKGDEIKVVFNIGGRLWQADGKPERCFNALRAWKIEKLGSASNVPEPIECADEGDLPF